MLPGIDPALGGFSLGISYLHGCLTFLGPTLLFFRNLVRTFLTRQVVVDVNKTRHVGNSTHPHNNPLGAALHRNLSRLNSSC